MRLSPSFSLLYYVTAVAAVASAQTTCVSDLTSIFQSEYDTQDLTVQREYILCPGTRFDVGTIQQDGSVINGQFPLVLRSNSKVKCGTDGSSANGCTIDGGTGMTAILLSPANLQLELVTENIVIEGVTVNFFYEGQGPRIFVGSTGGQITFRDCIFSELTSDPVFVMDEFIIANSRRRLEQTSETAGKIPSVDEIGRRLYTHLQNLDSSTSKETNSVERPSSEVEVHAARDRRLQAEPLTITFHSCNFMDIALPRNPISQGGLALLRFRASDPFGDPGMDVVSSMNVNLFNNAFTGNELSFEGDAVGLRAVIDFYSIGELRMENNCFVDSDVSVLKESSTVIVVNGATVTSVNNFVSPSQSDVLRCPFVTEIDVDYVFVQCGAAVASGTVCGSEGPAVAPTAQLMLPSTLETLQGSDQALSYFMRMVDKLPGFKTGLGSIPEKNTFHVTAFVPLDSAFEAKDQAGIDYYNALIDDPIWINHLSCVFSFHLHRGSLASAQFAFVAEGNTFLENGSIKLASPAPGVFTVNEIPLADGLYDIRTETGLIHHIADNLLEPRCVRDTISSLLLGAGQFNTLLALLGQTGIVLDDLGPFTLFAPLDSAFAKLPNATLAALASDPEAVKEILLYHVVAGSIVTLAPTLTAVPNSTISVQYDPASGRYALNGAALVLSADILSKDGVFSVIDTVLMPPQVTVAPVGGGGTAAPVTLPPVVPVTAAPVTAAPMMGTTTAAPVTAAPVTAAPMMGTAAPVTPAPMMGTAAPVTPAPTAAPTTPAPTMAASGTTTSSTGMLGGLVLASVLFVLM